MKSFERHVGFIDGLAYALAQCNDGEPTMTVTMPTDEWMDLELLSSALHYLNQECSTLSMKVEFKPTEGGAATFYKFTLATTENEKPLPDDWKGNL